MENDKNKAGRIERTMKDARAYATLLTEKVCLSLIENLSLLSNSLFVVALLVVLLSIAAIFFAVALTWALGIAIGSVFYAVLLMGKPAGQHPTLNPAATPTARGSCRADVQPDHVRYVS